MSTFLKIDYDEFNEKTTTEHPKELDWGKHKAGFQTDFKLVNAYQNIKLRHIKTKDLDSLVLDLHVMAKKWFHLRSGKLILNCDQDNIELKFHESQTEVKSSNPLDTADIHCFEYGYYKLTKKDVKKVCDAKVLKIRISGANSYEEPRADYCEAFQTYFQQFYNQFYDESKYADSLEKTVGKGGGGGGCFIATATMGNYSHPVVLELRSFRDVYLKERNWGRKFIEVYYKWGPYPASVIEKSYYLKMLSYYTIVKPLAFIASIMIEKK